MDVKQFFYKESIKTDLSAGLVVFLVAVPLCLGIALASGAPMFSGIISGIVGGIVVTIFSQSPLGVSGPAAGLAVIVLNAIQDLGAFEVFLMAVVLAGVIQIILGFLKAGIIAYYFPTSVIKGMLAGIGVIIFLKQIPHAFGYDAEPEGNLSFETNVEGSENTFLEIAHMLDHISLGVVIISIISIIILMVWESDFMKKQKWTTLLSGPLLVVVFGVVSAFIFNEVEAFKISAEHMVKVPISNSFKGFLALFTLPDFSSFTNPQVWISGIVIAVIASIETLLCVEAADKLDPHKRVTPTNRELIAQGTGNIVSGLIGGLPVTQVIVRSSANVQSGGQTRLSAFTHGVLLLISVIAIPTILNMIPLASLAAILLVVGYKLAKPSLFKAMYAKGWEQFIPFVITILGIVFTDLLTGIGIGMMIAIFFILYSNFKTPYFFYKHTDGSYHIDLSEQVTFLNKAGILTSLNKIPAGEKVIIDATRSVAIDHDIIEIIEDFKVHAKSESIDLTILGMKNAPQVKNQVKIMEKSIKSS